MLPSLPSTRQTALQATRKKPHESLKLNWTRQIADRTKAIPERRRSANCDICRGSLETIRRKVSVSTGALLGIGFDARTFMTN
ncbi:hypothetical protein TgHK011_006285 [Trichoderma gracile]|nr:hypothetical protein TgHK011_006285 [Trichoderma gracile]